MLKYFIDKVVKGEFIMILRKINKKFLIGAMLGLMAFSALGCTKKDVAESTLDKDTLIIGLDDAFAPMGFRDESGEIVGFDVDLAKELGERLDKEVTFQPIDWTMKEAELNSGNIDFIWNGYTITDDRKEKVNFSTPYLKNSQVIVTLANSDIKTKADLSNKKVGAQNESSAISAMEKEAELYSSFNGGKAITFEDNNQALMDLEAGRVDAIVADEILVRYYIKLKGEEKFNVLDENFGEEEYGVGMRKGDTKMVEAFNKALKEMKDDGTMKEIYKKWFGEDITE
jgi:polar amino acid transport system substrate-binding protein